MRTNWKSIALYLLECEAATVEYLMGIKSGSKSERRRHKTIVNKALAAISLGDGDWRVKDLGDVVKRCNDAARLEGT